MRIPESLASLFDYGVLEDVVRPLMSGKEAQVYLVVSGGKYAVAKIYKDAENRTFKHRAEYTEGRKVRNTRDQRAIGKRSKHGRQQDEAAWRSTEVDMIHRLHAAGVRVPIPHHFIDGVLVMELIVDAEGNPAPRLGDLALEPDAARAIYDRLIREVVKMLCAGIVHGDLSEFNVLMGADGPVIIDFPQSVDSAHNQNARKLLVRDVDNLHRFLARFVPGARQPPLAQEMWHLYEQNLLAPDTRLRGDYRAAERRVNTASVLELIDDAARDERKRRDSLGLRGGPPEPQYRPDAARPRPAASAPPRPAVPKKAPAVYQGLPNEGLSSFKYLLDKEPRNGAQRPSGPRHRGQDQVRHRPIKADSPPPQANRPTPAAPARHEPARRPPSNVQPQGAYSERPWRTGSNSTGQQGRSQTQQPQHQQPREQGHQPHRQVPHQPEQQPRQQQQQQQQQQQPRQQQQQQQQPPQQQQQQQHHHEQRPRSQNQQPPRRPQSVQQQPAQQHRAQGQERPSQDRQPHRPQRQNPSPPQEPQARPEPPRTHSPTAQRKVTRSQQPEVERILARPRPPR